MKERKEECAGKYHVKGASAKVGLSSKWHPTCKKEKPIQDRQPGSWCKRQRKGRPQSYQRFQFRAWKTKQEGKWWDNRLLELIILKAMISGLVAHAHTQIHGWLDGFLTRTSVFKAILNASMNVILNWEKASNLTRPFPHSSGRENAEAGGGGGVIAWLRSLEGPTV